MFRKGVALVLCFMMFLNTTLTHDVFASTLSTETINKIQNLEAYNGNIFDDKLLLNSNVSVTDIKEYLLDFYSLTTVTGKYKLNPYVFQKYKIVAYTNEDAVNKGIAGLTSNGSPKKETQTIINDDFTDRTETFFEYRYLGYKQDGTTIITNDFYPADSKIFVDPRDKNYLYNDPELESWTKKVLENKNMLNYYLKSKVQNDDIQNGVYEQTDYSIADITKVNNLDTLVKFPKVMSDVNFSRPATLNMIHMINGSQFYDTMRVKQYNYELKTTIDNVKVDVKLPVGTENYDITYDVTTLINNLEIDELSESGRYFKTIEVSGIDEPLFSNEEFEDRELTSLKRSLVKSIDLKGMKPNEKKSFDINAKSIATTFDKGVRTSQAIPVTVNVTLVANDAVDFIIKKNETDITSANVTVNKLDFSTPLIVTLENTSLIQSGDITSLDWYVETPTEWRHIQGGNEDIIQYTLNKANRNLLIDGKVSFKLVVSTADGVVGNSEQFILPIEKTSNNTGGDVVAVLTSSADFDERNDYYEVMEGQTFTLRGNKSYHKADLKITDYSFDVGEEFDEGVMVSGSKKSARAFYPNSDGGMKYKAYLTVTDEAGATDDTYIRTKVNPAKFDPVIDIYGTFKENRALTFEVSNEHSLNYYPIDETSLKWTITPLDGQVNSFKTVSSLNGNLSFDGQFKEKGRYKVSVGGNIESNYNSTDYYGFAEQTITINEDLEPIANFVVSEIVKRDVENGLMTDLFLQDLSVSIDGDLIVQRLASIKFDTDNDGLWDDETSIVFSVSNDTIVSYPSDHVGDYKFELTVKEEFGQPSISTFVNDSDKKRGNTDDKPIEQKITRIINEAPTVDLEVSQRKNVNLIIYEDLETSDKVALESKLIELETSLREKKIDTNRYYLSPSEKVGTQEVWTTYFDSYISVKIHVVGQDEDRDDIDHIEEFRFLLDSYSSEGNKKLAGYKNLKRFELVDVKWGNSDYKKYKYKGRTLDYTEYAWRELVVIYKENGIQKVKSYNFVYDYELSDEKKYTVYVDAYDYDTYDIVKTKLTVDEPSRSRPSFVIPNNTFSYRASDKPKLTLPSNVKKTVSVKKYIDSELDGVLEKCKNIDTFFLNLASKEENRIALDNTLVEKLKENNVNYMTLDDYALSINPITGKFDEVFLDNDGDFYISVGNTIYKLLMSARYYNHSKQLTITKVPYISVENKDLAIEVPKFFNKFGRNLYSMYTTGWKDWYGSNYTMQYGLEAINGHMYDRNYDSVNYMKTRNEQEVKDAWADPKLAEYALGKINPHLSVESDGSLIGQSYRVEREYYSRYNYIRVYKNYVRLGSGYVGATKFSVDAGNDIEAVGLIHSNGNIYFRKPVSYHVRYGITWSNFLTITDGTQNIEHMYYNKHQNLIYVATKNGKLYTYNGKTGQKKLLLDSFVERIGNSYKVSDGQWLIDGQTYNYKEVYTNENNPYVTRYQSGYATTTFYLNEQDEFRVHRKRHTAPKGGTLVYDYDYLLAKNVKTIFIKGRNDIYSLETYSTSVDAFAFPSRFYEDNDGNFHDVGDKINTFKYWYDPSTLTYNEPKKVRYEPKNLQFIGNWNYVDVQDHYRQFSYQLYAEELETGLGIRETINNYPRSFAYAALTKGTASNCVGDGELTTVTTLSSSYSTLDELKNSIFKNYENYSTSENMIVLLGEVVNTSLVMQDFEDDPAYSMNTLSTHVDPNYYENSLGRDPNSGLNALNRFNYVGIYEYIAKVRDNPVEDDDRFDEYRLWNKDDTKVMIYVHRKPVAEFITIFSENGTKFNMKATDNNSYDLDHESLSNKGIKEWEWSFKKEDDIKWQISNGKEFVFTEIVPNKKYFLGLRVKDLENQWSELNVKEIKIEEIPIVLSCKLQPEKSKFSIIQVPVSENIRLFDLTTIYSKPLKLLLEIYKDEVLIESIGEIEFTEGVTGTLIDSFTGEIRWFDKIIKIPDDFSDDTYELKVKAAAIDNSSKEDVSFEFGVNTPINLVPLLPEVFTANEDVEVVCRTSKYTNSVSVTLFKGTSKESTLPMIYEKMESNKKVWKVNYTVPEGLDDGTYNAIFTGTVNTTPVKPESVIRTFEYITLKILSAVMFPEDPMAGDELTWIIESIGGVDKYEIIFDQDIIDNDEREKMGYTSVNYPFFVEVNENESKKTDELKYTLWCTTPQSKTLKGVRNRGVYTFKIRAWKGTSYVDVDFTKEVIGDVRQLLKIGV